MQYLWSWSPRLNPYIRFPFLDFFFLLLKFFFLLLFLIGFHFIIHLNDIWMIIIVNFELIVIVFFCYFSNFRILEYQVTPFFLFHFSFFLAFLQENLFESIQKIMLFFDSCDSFLITLKVSLNVSFETLNYKESNKYLLTGISIL